MHLLRPRLIAGALALAIASTTALAQAVPRLKYEKYKLANGLEVILHEDRSVPLVAVNTWYHLGSGHEVRGRTGFAHLFEHMMFAGSLNAPTGQYDKLITSNGGEWNGSTYQDHTNYYATMPSHGLELALWLDADRMGHLLEVVSKERLDVQRDVVKNERRQRYDNVPYGRETELILKTLFPADHPMSWAGIGSMEDLSAASLDDVMSFHRTYYVPNNATLVIAGDFSADSARKWVQKYFGGIPRGAVAMPQPAVPTFTLARDTFVVQEDRVQLPRVNFVWHGVKLFHDDDASLDVLGDILGSGRNSRLYKKLVYDRQIAQDVTAFHANTKLDGYIRVFATAKPGHTPAELASAIEEEINILLREGPNEREIKRAKNSRRTSFLDAAASIGDKADLMNSYNDRLGDPDYLSRDAARYDAVTVESVRRAAQAYLSKPRVVLTTVPEGKKDLMVTRVVQ